MKKLFLLIPLIAISATGISGCKLSNGNSSKPLITYGTLVDQKATEIKYTDLQVMIATKENFLLAIHQDMMGGTECSCWITFKGVIDKYVQEYNTKVYYIDRSQFSDDDDSFGLTLLNGSTNPVFALVKEGKKINEYIYGKDTKPLFETVDGMRKVIEKIARDPQYMYVDQSYLDNALFVEKKDKVVIQYVWHTCDDCKDCIPNVMQPYMEKNTLSNKVWIINLAIKGLLVGDDNKQDTSRAEYKTFLAEHHMSVAGDEVYGYDRGFVPTTQVWEKGELKDMNVYFNDSYEQVEGEWKITRSYYTEERVQALKYTDTVLQNMVIPNGDIMDVEFNGNTYHIWNKDKAREAHKPILEAFLDYYVK